MTDGQSLIDKPKNPAAESLRRMADRIERNAADGFGGCVVIIPPEGAGAPIEMLTICDQADIAQFYANINARVQARVSELQDQQARSQAFRR